MCPDLKFMTFINSGKASAIASLNNDSSLFSILPLELQIDVHFSPHAHLLVVSPPFHISFPGPALCILLIASAAIFWFQDSLLNCVCLRLDPPSGFHVSVITASTSRGPTCFFSISRWYRLCFLIHVLSSSLVRNIFTSFLL